MCVMKRIWWEWGMMCKYGWEHRCLGRIVMWCLWGCVTGDLVWSGYGQNLFDPRMGLDLGCNSGVLVVLEGFFGLLRDFKRKTPRCSWSCFKIRRVIPWSLIGVRRIHTGEFKSYPSKNLGRRWSIISRLWRLWYAIEWSGWDYRRRIFGQHMARLTTRHLIEWLSKAQASISLA